MMGGYTIVFKPLLPERIEMIDFAYGRRGERSPDPTSVLCGLKKVFGWAQKKTPSGGGPGRGKGERIVDCAVWSLVY
jgi:hypothetical protein